MAEHQIRQVVEYYKIRKGYGSQTDWDSNHFARHVKIAKELLRIAPSDWREAIDYISDKLEKNNMEWTLETIFKKYPDFKKTKKSERVQRLEHLLDDEKRRY